MKDEPSSVSESPPGETDLRRAPEAEPAESLDQLLRGIITWFHGPPSYLIAG